MSFESSESSESFESSEPIIRARGLGKAYPIYQRPSDRLKQMVSRGRWVRPREFWALRGTDLEVYRGEAVGIVGRNGSGKSTLLEMISGTLEPSEGELEVYGRVAALLELGAGFNPEFSGRENVHINAAILGLGSKEIEARFDDIVAFADIGDFLDQPVKTYSSGMYARLAFAVAIHTMPEVLVVDEILSVGDEAFQRKCFAKLEAIRAAGGAILFVSHSSASVIELCDRAILLDAGEHLLTGTPRTVVALYQKLAYASAAGAEAVRAEIREEARAPGSYDAALEAAAGEAPQVVPEEPVDASFFDPSLVSSSIIHYEVRGARLCEPRILNAAGETVNCLEANRRYVFRYEVEFEKDAFDVRYHTMVKTVTGLELGGGTHPVAGAPGFEVAAGRRMSVSFEFSCTLNPGVYFLNCGVTGSGGQQLHRIVDALAFRVLAIAEVSTFGHVHFGHRASVSEEARGEH
jgi:lipopolysaccharide transport system ATP-binding protein